MKKFRRSREHFEYCRCFRTSTFEELSKNFPRPPLPLSLPPRLASSLADLGAQVQKLLRDKLERELGRPLERSGGGGGRSLKLAAGDGGGTSGQMAIVPAGNVVPQEPEQVQ